MKSESLIDKDLHLNIYMSGVGGQGIGVLSEVLLRAYDNAGYDAKGVDTHGLAQRGGKVESHLRIGHRDGNPLIEPGTADIAICLERTEAYRAMVSYLRPGGILIYYNTSWQPLQVRLGSEDEITSEIIEAEGKRRNARIHQILNDSIKDVRLQNIKLLSGALKMKALSGLRCENIEKALSDLFLDDVLESNIEILNCE